MKKILYLLCLLFTLSLQAQKMPDLGLERVRLNEKDATVLAEIKEVKSAPPVSTEKRYFWYSGGQIRSTQGGYSGKLLNGGYKEYYLNKNLRAQGRYKKGLQAGDWDYWYPDGSLREQVFYKAGLRQGIFREFDTKGNLKRQGKYRNDILNGKVRTYTGADSVSYSRYKNGKLVKEKTAGGNFWKRHNPFKKAEKAKGQVAGAPMGESKKELRAKKKLEKAKAKEAEKKGSMPNGMVPPGNKPSGNNNHY